MASLGFTHQDMCKVLEISEFTLLKYFRKEMERGHVTVYAAVAGSLIDRALEGDVGACRFYLSARHGWVTQSAQQVSGTDGGALEIKVVRNLIGIDQDKPDDIHLYLDADVIDEQNADS